MPTRIYSGRQSAIGPRKPGSTAGLAGGIAISAAAAWLYHHSPQHRWGEAGEVDAGPPRRPALRLQARRPRRRCRLPPAPAGMVQAAPCPTTQPLTLHVHTMPSCRLMPVQRPTGQGDSTNQAGARPAASLGSRGGSTTAAPLAASTSRASGSSRCIRWRFTGSGVAQPVKRHLRCRPCDACRCKFCCALWGWSAAPPGFTRHSV